MRLPTLSDTDSATQGTIVDLRICKLVCTLHLHQAHDLRFKDEMSLLEDNVFDSLGSSQEHELCTAPIMAWDANEQNSLTQYGVLGKVFY